MQFIIITITDIFIMQQSQLLFLLDRNFQRYNVALIHLIALFVSFVTLLRNFQDVLSSLYRFHYECTLSISDCLVSDTSILAETDPGC